MEKEKNIKDLLKQITGCRKSASILRENMSLIQEQMAALNKRFGELKGTEAQLRVQIAAELPPKILNKIQIEENFSDPWSMDDSGESNWCKALWGQKQGGIANSRVEAVKSLFGVLTVAELKELLEY